jgi:hypothetical protein
MKKKIIWILLGVIVLVGAGYVGYYWNKKNTARVVEDLINKSEGRIGKCAGSEYALGDICEGGTTSAGGYTFCWGPGGLGIKCRQ